MSSITIDLPDPPHNAPPLEERIEDYFERITPPLKTALQDAFRQWLEGKPADHVRKNPFAMSFDEFEKLSRAEQSEIRRQAFSRNRAWIHEQLQKYRAEWIVVVGGMVEKFSSTLDDEPTRSEIKKMGQKKGLVPFLFAREPKIEESVATNAAFHWSEIGTVDFYPTIGIVISPVDVGNSNMTNNINWLMADFDTGSPVIIVRSVDVEQSGIELEEYEEKWAAHLGAEYRFVTPQLQISVQSESQGLKVAVFRPRVVYDWATSPFVLINPNRVALVGRNLLLQLGFDVLLKGTERKTIVM